MARRSVSYLTYRSLCLNGGAALYSVFPKCPGIYPIGEERLADTVGSRIKCLRVCGFATDAARRILRRVRSRYSLSRSKGLPAFSGLLPQLTS